jgi:hypothetical protein
VTCGTGLLQRTQSTAVLRRPRGSWYCLRNPGSNGYLQCDTTGYEPGTMVNVETHVAKPVLVGYLRNSTVIQRQTVCFIPFFLLQGYEKYLMTDSTLSNFLRFFN